MQNIDIRFRASQTGFKGVEAQMQTLTKQAAVLNKTISSTAYAKAPALVDPKAWQRGTDAVSSASREYLRAVSSSNLLNATQIRATSLTKQYTEALQKQKLSMMDMVKNRGIMKGVYEDQLRIQHMTSQYWGTDQAGRAVQTITVPKNVPIELDNMRRRMGMFGNMVASASTQMVNLGKNIQWSGRQLMVGFTYPMALAGAAAGVMAYKTEAAFAKINKVYDVAGGANASQAQRSAELNRLRADSMEMATESAAKYGTTLQKTLGVEAELAATGLRGNKLLSATTEVNRISNLGDIDPGETTKMVVALQTAFKDTIPDAASLTKTLNFMNQVSNVTSLSLQDIAEATPRAASGMAALGVTAEQMTILLVSMREAGVEASEGANALKSATARILNPAITQKATEMYKSFGADIDVAGISDAAKGNLADFIKLLGEATNQEANLTDKQKQTAIATLFGTYQFNRLTAAVTNMGDAYGGVENQTKKAIDAQQLSNEELARQAKISEDLMMKNPAGRLRIAWAKFGVELNEIGGPFLAVAEKVVGGITMIAEKFNDMADWKKKAIIAALGIMAIVGPVIMLTGLFVNLAGQAGKGVAWFLKFAGVSTLLTERQQAEALATQQQNVAFKQQIVAVSTLTREIQALTQAYGLANNAAMGRPSTAAPLPGQPGFIGPMPPQARQPLQAPVGVPLVYNRVRGDAVKTEQNRQVAIARHLAYEEKATQEKRLQGQAQDKINQKMNATNAAIGIGSLAMAGMLTTQMGMFGGAEGTVSELSKLALIGTMVVPALSLAVNLMSAMVARAIAYSTEMKRAALASLAAGRGTVGAAGGMKMAAKGAVGSIGAMMGPVGWTVTAVTAVSLGLVAWNKHIKKAREEELAFNKSINSTAEDFTKNLGLQKQEYLEIEQIRDKARQTSKYDAYLDAYRNGNDGAQATQSAKDFGKLGGADSEQYAEQHFLQLMSQFNMSAEDAALSVKALYAAADKGAAEANVQVKELLGTYGKMDAQLQKTKYADVRGEIFNQQPLNSKEADANGKLYAEAWMRAFTGAKPEVAKALFSNFQNIVVDQYTAAYNKIMSNIMMNPNVKKLFTDAGITSGQGLMDYLKNNAGSVSSIINSMAQSDIESGLAKDLQLNVNAVGSQVQKLYNDLASDPNSPFGQEWAGKSITNIDELKGALLTVFNQKFVGYDEGLAKVKEFKEAFAFSNGPGGNGVLSMLPDTLFKGLNEAQALSIVQQMNLNQGFVKGTNLTQAIANYMGQVTTETNAAAGAARGFSSALSGIGAAEYSPADLSGIRKTAMSNVQAAMAADAGRTFDSKWDNRIDGAQAGAQNRQDQIAKQKEKALDAIQRQIDAEKKADETRQKLFENEKARLAKIAELMNAQIDFDAAVNTGNLDEAAKIQNNMIVTTQSDQMDKDNDVAQTASDKKVDALEKREKEIEKIYDRRAKAAQKASDANIKSLQRTRDYEKASLDNRLAIFQGYTARNQKDLEKWMKNIGVTYDTFGGNLSKDGGKWSETFKSTLNDQLRLASVEVANDQMWARIAKRSATQLLNAMGFKDSTEFGTFVSTGKLPEGYTGKAYTETRHDGGIIGGSGSSRGNIPNTYSGLHSSETMIRAQKGEFIVNRTAAKQNRGILHAINSGVLGGNATVADYQQNNLAPNFGGLYGIIAGANQVMMRNGIKNAMMRGLGLANGRPGPGNAGSADMANTSVGGGYIPGAGGRHRPVSGGGQGGRIHGSPPAVDLPVPVGSPLYAVADGKVTSSYDIPGVEPRVPSGGLGYKSYGRVINLRTDTGANILYAHLSKRSVGAGTKVKGGAQIGLSGNTGNSFGPHLHFGASNGPKAWLRNGGEIKWDNTPAVLHSGESVLTKSLTSKMKENVATGGNAEYHTIIDMRNSTIANDVDVEKVMDKWWANKDAKVGRKKVVR